MYPSALQLQISLTHPFKCVVVLHSKNGFAETVKINETDAVFFARQKTRLIKEFGFTPDQAEKMIEYREKIADIFVDRWIEKSSHSLNQNDNEHNQ